MQTARTDISSAITNKGIILPEDAGFENFASAIDSIETSSLPKYGIGSLYYTGSIGSGFNRSTRITTFPSSYSFSKNILHITCDSIYNNSYGDGSKEINICSPSIGDLSLYNYTNNDIITFSMPAIKNKTIITKLKVIESSGTVRFSNRYYSIECLFKVSIGYQVGSDKAGISLGSCNFYRYSSYSTEKTADFTHLIGQSNTNTVTIPNLSVDAMWVGVSAIVKIVGSASNYGYLYPQSITPISIKVQIDIQSIE